MSLLLFVLIILLTGNEQKLSSLFLISMIPDSTEQKDSTEGKVDSLTFNDDSMALKVPKFDENFSKYHLKIVKPHTWVDYKVMISKPDLTVDYKMLIKGLRRSGLYKNKKPGIR